MQSEADFYHRWYAAALGAAKHHLASFPGIRLAIWWLSLTVVQLQIESQYPREFLALRLRCEWGLPGQAQLDRPGCPYPDDEIPATTCRVEGDDHPVRHLLHSSRGPAWRVGWGSALGRAEYR